MTRMVLIALGLSAFLLSSCCEKREGGSGPEGRATGSEKGAFGLINAGGRTLRTANRAVESQDSRLEQARDLSGGGNPTGE